MRIKAFVLILFCVFALSGLAACSTQPSDPNQSEGASKQEPAPDPGKTIPATGREVEIPMPISSAFPDALITKQHSELTESQLAAIEQKSGSKLNETDFDAFIAYGKEGDKDTRLGAASVVDVTGLGEPTQLVVIYTNDLVIKEVTLVKGTSDVASRAFLVQFAGKNSDQPFQVGKDVKYNGKNTEDAKALTQALKLDLLTMQAIFGKSNL